jgi:ribA/ribD-fused uncharacterized protein
MSQQKFHFFWGGPFSNWFYAPIVVDGVEYDCTEQHMMAMKAKLFGDEKIHRQIMEAHDPATQKALGRKVKNFNKEQWEAIAREVVYQGNLVKFTTDGDLKTFILNTGDDIIVEASPTDTLWGIGLSANDPRAKIPSQWRGLNWLGEVLMRVRETIRNQEKQ